METRAVPPGPPGRIPTSVAELDGMVSRDVGTEGVRSRSGSPLGRGTPGVPSEVKTSLGGPEDGGRPPGSMGEWSINTGELDTLVGPGLYRGS